MNFLKGVIIEDQLYKYEIYIEDIYSFAVNTINIVIE